ncbi:hypothetical protein [Microbacterium sp. WCS2018Hpa-23]|uniref:hypothetical protein n=1 Tax=Microbacterium sp. WCS2018Hpa-23 TaxID=3073634 RepID=UPI002883150F|nr:hypothetical protein [Microbacterium sp. WCS2018Hpa-23]
MSEPNAEPSLIQQRMALQRRKNFAVYSIVFSAIMVAGWVVTLVLDPSALYRWIGPAVFGAGVIIGILELRKARRAIGEFEGRHGRRAGLQD